MRIHTVADLKEALEELPDDMPIMAQFQPTYPLREYIGGIWIDDGRDEDDEINCGQCLRLTLEEPVFMEKTIANDEGWYAKCFMCGSVTEVPEPQPDTEKVAYIILNGHPYEGTPYGSKRAWNEI